MSDLYSVDRFRFLKIVKGQMLILVFLSGIGMVKDGVLVYSLLLGGLIPVLGNWFFAWRVFRHYSAAKQGEIVGRFYQAEIEKLLLTGLFFALVFIYINPLNVFGFFSSFILMQFSQVVLYQIIGK